MTRVFIWKNNSPQEWEEISFSAFSKARRNGCFTGRFFVETVKMFRDEDDRIIMECSRKDFEKYQQEDRHSRYLQEHEKSRSISRHMETAQKISGCNMESGTVYPAGQKSVSHRL